MSDIEKLPLLLENLDLLKEDSQDALALFDRVISFISDPENLKTIDLGQYAKEVAAFIGCNVVEVESKAAQAIAELCKVEGPRAALSTNEVIGPLVKMLSSSFPENRQQACRAIANICFDNNEGRNCVFGCGGLADIVEVLRMSAFPDSDVRLRTNAVGCLLNVIMGQDQCYPQVVEMGVMEILCDLLTFGIGTKTEEETAVHIYVILGLLTDAGSSVCISEKLCGVTVKILSESSNGELSELCIELLHSQAEKEDVRLHLAKAGLCELLIELMEKHGRLADDDETRNLLKMACDLIVFILNGDASMELAFNDGKGRVYKGLCQWLSSADDDLQVTAVLAMANFARTDKHCEKMVQLGVSKELLNLLSQNNTSDAKIRLQHALLGALRNLVIPTSNKGVVLKQGLFQAVYPMFTIPTFPVVFKLLGTLRLVIDGEPEAATELGKKADIVTKIVEWCSTDDHPGVQGEANRLLAWIIKNSRDRDVIGNVVDAGGIECLVKMTRSESVLMQAEAFLALHLTAAIRGTDAEPSLLKANIGEAITEFLVASPQREIFQNLLAIIGLIISSAEMRKHLREAGVPKALYSATLAESLADLREQVSRLTTMMDPAG
ncbi:rap1 GTPase-GDP dissociation stimulator [Nesidiocoris tenuis]|uniref:Rap1 GTPase-GDP dissociation stimulator n=1 Tax=Nesidiocoris tenuis TaxID=355587 RepID=A0ABN7AM32_9HEMI|nr:rap1 GTPase-GDP dissociation stimulator [Nesidiocoris tenuis]